MHDNIILIFLLITIFFGSCSDAVQHICKSFENSVSSRSKLSSLSELSAAMTPTLFEEDERAFADAVVAIGKRVNASELFQVADQWKSWCHRIYVVANATSVLGVDNMVFSEEEEERSARKNHFRSLSFQEQLVEMERNQAIFLEKRIEYVLFDGEEEEGGRGKETGWQKSLHLAFADRSLGAAIVWLSKNDHAESSNYLSEMWKKLSPGGVLLSLAREEVGATFPSSSTSSSEQQHSTKYSERMSLEDAQHLPVPTRFKRGSQQQQQSSSSSSSSSAPFIEFILQKQQQISGCLFLSHANGWIVKKKTYKELEAESDFFNRSNYNLFFRLGITSAAIIIGVVFYFLWERKARVSPRRDE